MAVESLTTEQRPRRSLSRRVGALGKLRPNREATAEETFDQRPMSNSGGDNREDQRAAGEEIELELNS